MLKVPDAYSGHPIDTCITNCYQLGHDLIDHVHCIDASLPEHEALPSSHKMCLQIEAVIFICTGEDLTRSIRSCPT